MRKVMVFGVFDLLHPGHINFLQQAKRYGDYLVVSVARDKNVKKVKNKLPFRDEKQRVALVRSLKIADKVVLGAVGNPWPHIRKEKPDIIALGYDQKPYVDMGELKKVAKVVRLKPFEPKIFKTKLLRPLREPRRKVGGRSNLR